MAESVCPFRHPFHCSSRTHSSAEPSRATDASVTRSSAVRLMYAKFHNFICQWIVSKNGAPHCSQALPAAAISLCDHIAELKTMERRAHRRKKLSWTSLSVCHLANTNFQVAIEIYRARVCDYTGDRCLPLVPCHGCVARLPTAVHPI